MRFTIPAINNDYYDEDYLRVFGFKSLGKNIRVHRSVVFMKPSGISIGDNVNIGPYCVFGEGETEVQPNVTLAPFTYEEGYISPPKIETEARVKELEALLQAKEDAEKLKHVR